MADAVKHSNAIEHSRDEERRVEANEVADAVEPRPNGRQPNTQQLLRIVVADAITHSRNGERRVEANEVADAVVPRLTNNQPNTQQMLHIVATNAVEHSRDEERRVEAHEVADAVEPRPKEQPNTQQISGVEYSKGEERGVP